MPTKKTAAEVEVEFLAKLNALLLEFSEPTGRSYVEVEIEEDRRGLPSIVFNIPAIWDEDGRVLREDTEINIGRWLRAEPIGEK